MGISRKKKEIIKNKYNGLCGYSGTPLEDNWEVDHIVPIIFFKIGIKQGNPDDINNLIPTQKFINHYKRGLDIEEFRTERLGKLHHRLKKLPKNPRTEKSKRHNDYMRKIAKYFAITEEKPFSGKFYFELININQKK